MSATVASRCRSTNWVLPPAPDGSGTRHSTSGAARPPGVRGGGQPASAPARWPGRSAPRAPPAARRPGTRPGRTHRPRRRRRPGRRAPPRARRRRALVVAQPAAGLAEQVHRRVPPAADQQQVAGDRRADPTSPPRSGATSACVTRSTPRVPVTTLPADDRDARVLALLAAARRPRRPGVDHGLHPHTGAVQVDRGVVGAVVRGEHHDLAARRARRSGSGRSGRRRRA